MQSNGMGHVWVTDDDPAVTAWNNTVVYCIRSGIKVSMSRKSHNHRRQTNQGHRKEEAQNKDSHNTIKITQPGPKKYNASLKLRELPIDF